MTKRPIFLCGLTGFVLSGLFLFASPLHAEQVCCACTLPGDERNTNCITIDSAELGSATDCTALPARAELESGWTCEPVPLKTQCKTIAQGGSCTTPPLSFNAYKTARAGETKVSAPAANQSSAGLPFELNVPLPGFTGSAVSPGLFADYLSAAFRYGISIVAIAATIMFIWGGFVYMVGSTTGSIKKGKEIMTDALVGMMLVLASTLILRTLNPALISLQPIEVTPIESLFYNDPYIMNSVAPDILSEAGLAPSAQMRIPSYGIPAECPGRDPSAQGAYGGYALNYKQGMALTQDVIDAYLEEQRVTGVPAAVIIAQMITETGRAGRCIALNLFKDPTICSRSAYVRNYNFGGIGCSQKQVPSDACAHGATTPPSGNLGSAGGPDFPLTAEIVNAMWNKNVSANCVKLFNDGTLTQNYSNCGDKCFPIKSHTTITPPGASNVVWVDTVQCSRKFENAQEFLASHLQAVRACLPFNDSVYSFAYCVGASSYASAPDKGKVLADIIERNCLCDPEKDSRHCVRDKQLENDIKNQIIKKTNLFRLYSAGKFDQAAQDRVVQKLYEKTQGRLVPLPVPNDSDVLPAALETPS